MLLQAVLFTVAAASCWLTDTACSIQVIWTVQLAGPPPGVGGQLIVAVGLGSRAASDTLHRARAEAARRRDVVVFESERACSLAIPRSPTQITMTATMTSTRLKPRERTFGDNGITCRSPGCLRASG